MLVYLDTAHLANLERASRDEQAQFFSVWNDHACELALSLHHLHEIGQLSGPDSISRRFDIIDKFANVRSGPSGSPDVIDIEIQTQFLAQLGSPTDIGSMRERLFPTLPARLLRDEVLANEFLFKKMRSAFQAGADAKNAGKIARGVIADPNLDDEVLRLSEPEQLTAVNESLLHLVTIFQTHMPQKADQFADMFHRFKEANPKQNPREMMAHVYDLGQFPSFERVLEQDLAHVCVFYDLARDLHTSLAARLGIDSVLMLEIMRNLDPYCSPGFALQLAVKRARGSHPKPDVASDDVDVDHLVFAPYVDLMFVDRRTFGFINQEVKRFPTRIPKLATQSIRRAGTLELVTQMIANAGA